MPRQLSMTPAAIASRKYRAKQKQLLTDTQKQLQREKTRERVRKFREKKKQGKAQQVAIQTLREKRATAREEFKKEKQERQKKIVKPKIVVKLKKIVKPKEQPKPEPDIVLSQPKETQLRYKGNPILSYSIKLKNPMTPKELSDKLTEIFDKFDRKMIIKITAHFLELGFFRSSIWFRAGSKARIYDPQEYEYDGEILHTTIDKAIAYVAEYEESDKGGADEHNDCLYHCISEAMNGNVPYFTTPGKLKKFLNLKRDDKIAVSKIPEIEDKIKARINVFGDVEYISGKSYLQIIRVKLENEHYTLKPHNQLKKAIIDKYNPPATYIQREKDVLVYDGKKEFTMTTEQFLKYKNKPYKSPYNFIKATNDIVGEFNEFTQQAKQLYYLSNKRVNVLRTGNPKMEALKLFMETSKSFEPEPMTEEEQIFLENAFRGGLIYAEKTTLDNATTYDMNSMYPSIMASNFTYPLSQGEIHTLTELPDILSYGIYRVKISNINYKLFTENKRNYYTHVDINRARELGFSIELIQDNQANALIYKKRANGKHLFGEFVNTMYELKQKNKLAKTVLNSLWGALAQKNVKNKIINEKDTYEIKNIKHLESIIPTNNGVLIREYKEKKFKTDYARMAPFLTARGRYLISKAIEPNQQYIYRIHTDGFISEKELQMELSSEMGKWKIEQDKCGKVQIQNANIVKVF